MITPSDKLVLLEDFRVDRRLPKFKPTRTPQHRKSKFALDSDEAGDEDAEDMSLDDFIRQEGRVTLTRRNALVISGEIPGIAEQHQPPPPSRPWYSRVFDFWRRAPEAGQLAIPETPPPPLTIEQFFASLKNSTEELHLVEERLDGYRKALADAMQTGQQALCEQLVRDIDAVRAETQLHAIGLNQFLSEDTIVRFYKDSPRGLRLDWVANFTRIIPDEVRVKKVRCDDLR